VGEEGTDPLELPPRTWFLVGALDKEVRLSFAPRIEKTVPESYRKLIGPEKEKDVPDFKYNNPGRHRNFASKKTI